MTPDEDKRTYVLFRLGEERYALPVEAVTGVVRYEPPMTVPRAPHSVMGVINLRGRVLPVVDLKARLGAKEFSAGAHARILVAESPAGPVGVAVDAVTEVATFSAEQIRPMPDGVVEADAAAAFAGMVERSDGLIILLDPEYAMSAAGLGSAQSAVGARKEEGSHA